MAFIRNYEEKGRVLFTRSYDVRYMKVKTDLMAKKEHYDQ